MFLFSIRNLQLSVIFFLAKSMRFHTIPLISASYLQGMVDVVGEQLKH
jgi:hypothetical protein